MNTIRKDSFDNSVHKRSQKKRVSFADSPSPSETEQPNINRKLVEIINIDSYKSFNLLRLNEDEEGEHQQSQSNGHFSSSNAFVTFDDETNYSLHNGSDYGNSCIIV